MSQIKPTKATDLGYHAGLSELETHCQAVVPTFSNSIEHAQWCVGYCDGLGVEFKGGNIAVQAMRYVLEKNNA